MQALRQRERYVRHHQGYDLCMQAQDDSKLGRVRPMGSISCRRLTYSPILQLRQMLACLDGKHGRERQRSDYGSS